MIVLDRRLLMGFGGFFFFFFFIHLGVYYGSCISGPYPFLYWFRRLQGMVVVVLGHPSTVLSWFLFPVTSPHSNLYVGWGLC